ncbi:MAG: PEGA domain-containing protein [Ignavibacteriales bacterium]|nr:PEGA domain-containing protein [Ignavibacteriales bacterium]
MVFQFPTIKPRKFQSEFTLENRKETYELQEAEINITPENTFFKVDLVALKLTEVTINSEPEGAEIFINEISEGPTSKTFFKFPGEYNLKLVKGGYLSYSGKLIVSKDKAQNNFKFNLVKSSGFVEILATQEIPQSL